MAELLLEQGLATVHFTAERSKYYHQLVAAENRAKDKKLNLWRIYTDEQKNEQTESSADDQQERVVDYQQVIVTEVDDSLRFAVQKCQDGPRLEKLMIDLRADFLTDPPMSSAYKARKNDICAGKFLDGQWYRCRVEAARGGKVDVLYIDFGNRHSIDPSELAILPSLYQSAPPGAREYSLALVQLPSDSDHFDQSVATFRRLVSGPGRLLLNDEYRPDKVTLFIEDEQGVRSDVGKTLIEHGLALVERRREKKLQTLMDEYIETEQKAKRERRNIWEYGDFTGNEL